MRTIFIFHGSYGYPEENWFPWLKKELEKLGNRIFVPQFPVPKSSTPGGHKLDQWLEAFNKYKKYVDKDTFIVAHSRGCVFSYYLIPTLKTKINSLFLVGPFLDLFRWKPDFYEEYDSFQSKPYLWKTINKMVNHIEVFQSTNDVIPVSEGTLIADNLDAKLFVVKNAKHFNVSENPAYNKFPLLLKRIQTRL